MRLDIDRIIQTGAGVTLSCLSVSGLMCINRGPVSGSCPTTGPVCKSGSCPALNCSKLNLNFGLGAMGFTGLLLVYKSVRM